MFPTAFCSTWSLVKMMAKSFLKMRMATMERIPNASDWSRTTMTAYMVALGRPDPSSFDTRTLK